MVSLVKSTPSFSYLLFDLIQFLFDSLNWCCSCHNSKFGAKGDLAVWLLTLEGASHFASAASCLPQGPQTHSESCLLETANLTTRNMSYVFIRYFSVPVDPNTVFIAVLIFS